VGLAEFTLSRRDPGYVSRSKAVKEMEDRRRKGEAPEEAVEILSKVGGDLDNTTIGSCIFARKPGDGSAREQAASCQKVLGGFANICYEYATKRYRSNCINWGIIPFTIDAGTEFEYHVGDWIYVPGIRKAILSGQETVPAKVVSGGEVHDLNLRYSGLTDEERQILADGCLINYYARKRQCRK
jgi:aconitate hydratase